MADSELNSLRFEIDKINDDILNLLLDRFKIVDQIKSCKKQNKLPLFDEKREAEILKIMESKITDSQLKEPVLAIYKELLSSTRRYLESQ